MGKEKSRPKGKGTITMHDALAVEKNVSSAQGRGRLGAHDNRATQRTGARFSNSFSTRE